MFCCTLLYAPYSFAITQNSNYFSLLQKSGSYKNMLNFMAIVYMNYGISNFLKLGLTVVRDVFCDVNCVKCKKVYGIMLHFSQVTH